MASTRSSVVSQLVLLGALATSLACAAPSHEEGPAKAPAPTITSADADTRTSATPTEVREVAEQAPLASMHGLVLPPGARVINLALVDLDEQGMPSTWGQSMRSRLLHKVVREKTTWVRIVSRDEVDAAMDSERAHPVGEQRFGEIRFTLDEGPSDAKIRVSIVELACASRAPLVTVPVGRVGIAERDLAHLREVIVDSIRASLQEGFRGSFHCTR